MQGRAALRQTMELPAGNYMLRLGVIDQTTKHIGALTAWLTVPEQTPARHTEPTRDGAETIGLT